MIRRTLLALLVTGTVLAGAATPAAAIPVPPPGGDLLIVFAYYADAAKTQIIGQTWHGCGQPSGSWGATSGIREVFFTPC
ncbi:DUF6289 family protein [Dactylosporangium sp. NPDC005555]|uniref:DUF6289 family protein n=1 Tax=Dactylosporangium sp. NPDC005555 TaxID=3154889 RepID=UPI0033A6D669